MAVEGYGVAHLAQVGVVVSPVVAVVEGVNEESEDPAAPVFRAVPAAQVAQEWVIPRRSDKSCLNRSRECSGCRICKRKSSMLCRNMSIRSWRKS